MGNVMAFMLALTMVFSLGACNSSEAEPQEEKLTLEVVRELSGKGEELTWSDFEAYEHKDIGSGLHVYYYGIDEHYCLVIGGGDTESVPMYIRLVFREDGDALLDDGEFIDIRTESVDDFLDRVSG